MNKRLRKKKHCGKFAVLCFTVVGETPENLMKAISDWGDSQGFLISGLVGSEKLHFDVERCRDSRCCLGKAHPYGAKEEDRSVMKEWLEMKGCTDVKCSPLWDSYHGKSPFSEGQ